MLPNSPSSSRPTTPANTTHLTTNPLSPLSSSTKNDEQQQSSLMNQVVDVATTLAHSLSSSSSSSLTTATTNNNNNQQQHPDVITNKDKPLLPGADLSPTRLVPQGNTVRPRKGSMELENRRTLEERLQHDQTIVLADTTTSATTTSTTTPFLKLLLHFINPGQQLVY